MIKKYFLVTLILLVGLLVGCSKNEKLITVVATAIPHEEILIETIPYLKEKGFDLKIVVISDYSLGNPAVLNGSADANYFQHIPYLNQFNKSLDESERLINALSVHIEPIGLYSGIRKTVDELKDEDEIIISDNQPDYGRIISFLKDLDLIEVVEGFNPLNVLIDPEHAIKTKKVNFKFKVIDASLLVQARKHNEGALFFINGNYALEGGLKYSDILIKEPTNNNPYVNILAVRNNNLESEKIKALIDVLQSKPIKDFINKTYNGAVISV